MTRDPRRGATRFARRLRAPRRAVHPQRPPRPGGSRGRRRRPRRPGGPRPPREARELVGADRLVGLSTHTPGAGRRRRRRAGRLHRRRPRTRDADQAGPPGRRPRARPLRGGARDGPVLRDRRDLDGERRRGPRRPARSRIAVVRALTEAADPERVAAELRALRPCGRGPAASTRRRALGQRSRKRGRRKKPRPAARGARGDRAESQRAGAPAQLGAAKRRRQGHAGPVRAGGAPVVDQDRGADRAGGRGRRPGRRDPRRADLVRQHAHRRRRA